MQDMLETGTKEEMSDQIQNGSITSGIKSYFFGKDKLTKNFRQLNSNEISNKTK